MQPAGSAKVIVRMPHSRSAGPLIGITPCSYSSARTASTSSTMMANCPMPFCAWVEGFARRHVFVCSPVLQEDVHVLEAKDCNLFLFAQRHQTKDVSIERLRAFKVADDQIDGTDLLLPLRHPAPFSTPPSSSLGPFSGSDRRAARNSSIELDGC